MSQSRLPQLAGGLFLSDGGLETTLVFLDGVELQHFAAFVLLDDEVGRERLMRYYMPYLKMCADTPGSGGFVLETPTWRASPDWARLVGFDEENVRRLNRVAAELLQTLARRWSTRTSGPIVVSGVIGPRGDGYRFDGVQGADDAARYHATKAEALADGGVDMLAAVTMTNSAEALGVALADERVGLPVAVSFTVETDGRLPSGEALGDAIGTVDAKAQPAYYAINCAHPSHFDTVLADGGTWTARIRAIRANASPKSHAELDASTELDLGDPADLAQRYRGLRGVLPGLNVPGGCCGTDWRHLRAIRDAWVD